MTIRAESLIGIDALTVREANLERARPTRWAWHHRIALGYLNLLAGNEGAGKGTLVAWLIAQLTTGKLGGHLHGQPVGVGVLGDEDGFDDVWVPRLHAVGADLSRVVQIERPDGGFVDVREDRERLAHVVRANGLRVLFFDQLLDNLGAGTDDWRQKPVRDSLQPLRALARELDVAALGSLHPNKRGATFRELMAGTVAFNSVSRCSLLLGQHPDDEDLRVVLRGKGNYSKAPDALEFSISSYKFPANGYTFDVPRAEDFAVSDVEVDDLLGNDRPKLGHSKVADACEIIEALLPRDGAWHPAKPIYETCGDDENGINERTVKRAKVKLGIEHKRSQTFHAPVEWRWPSSQDTLGPCVTEFPSVPTVPSTNGRNPLRGSTGDTQDTRERPNTWPDCDPSSHQAELDRLRTKFPDLEGSATPPSASRAPLHAKEKAQR